MTPEEKVDELKLRICELHTRNAGLQAEVRGLRWELEEKLQVGRLCRLLAAQVWTRLIEIVKRRTGNDSE